MKKDAGFAENRPQRRVDGTTTTVPATAFKSVTPAAQVVMILAAGSGIPRIKFLYRYPTTGSAITLNPRETAEAMSVQLNT